MIFFLPIPFLFLFQGKVLLNPYVSLQSCFINQEANFLKAKPSYLLGIVSCSYFYKSLGLRGASEFSLSEPSLCRGFSSHIICKVYFTLAYKTSSMLPSSAPSPASKWRGTAACNKCLPKLNGLLINYCNAISYYQLSPGEWATACQGQFFVVEHFHVGQSYGALTAKTSVSSLLTCHVVITSCSGASNNLE